MSRVCRRVLLLWALFSVWLGACDAFLNPSSPWNIRRHSMLPKLIVQFSNSERAARRNSDGSSAWKVGDVYKDLDRLERAINFANAEQNLKQVERMELLQHFSSARRPLFPDMRKFIITPLGLGLVMRFVRLNSTTSFVSRICTMGLDFHFWTFVVAAPIFLLAAKKISKAPPEPMPEEIRDLDPEYLSFVTPFIDWESPEKSCRDYVMFLLEFWTSAVACMAVIGALQLLVKLPRHNSVRFWLAVTQLFTRIAALASLYQYPKQMFQLQRSKQPRPLGLFPTLMQTLVSCMFIAAPLGISSDLSKVLVFLQKDSLVALYSSVPAFIFGTWIRTQHTEPLLFRKLNPRSFGERLLYTAASLAFWKKPISNFCESLTRFPTQKIVHRFKMAPFRNTFATTMLLSVVMFPILT